ASYVKVGVRKKEEFLVIELRDNGLGMSEEVKEKVFDMFFRGIESSSGPGLGLYLVKNAVDFLKGRISLESEEYLGVSFTIFLPYKF
ncbi:sensor histidine kinase, partial [Xanthovirga aplysinae]|uniref:sensor histidine kinase n=1 Tax=Xanthovirga aplysinae TaxID=2529853 RepID=UPI0016575D38